MSSFTRIKNGVLYGAAFIDIVAVCPVYSNAHTTKSLPRLPFENTGYIAKTDSEGYII